MILRVSKCLILRILVFERNCWVKEFVKQLKIGFLDEMIGNNFFDII